MRTPVRFGKKMRLPSTIELKHEMRLMAAADALADAVSRQEVEMIVRDLACKHGLSNDRARMLVSRFGTGRRELEGAAQDLRATRMSF